MPTFTAWEMALLNLAAPFEIMKFTLHFDGNLPAGGNGGKPADIWRIRNQLHPQLADLWTTHPILAGLKAAPVPKDKTVVQVMATGGPAANLSTALSTTTFTHSVGQPVAFGFLKEADGEALCQPILHGGSGYFPLVRKSLGLACDMDIVFLRKGDPGSTITQGGDLDNRIKTLFDALRMPAPNEQPNPGAGTPEYSPLYCLLESDALVHDFAVHPDRLLNRPNGSEKEVRLTITVTVKVLNVMLANMRLLGA